MHIISLDDRFFEGEDPRLFIRFSPTLRAFSKIQGITNKNLTTVYKRHTLNIYFIQTLL